MAIISVETVAFTKSALKKGFNGDNINIKGHAIPQEKADSGYQAKGTMDLPCRALVASSENKCAYDAAEAFRDYFHNIDNARGDAQGAVEEYISDMDTVMSKMANAELSLGLVCVYDNRVVVGKSRDCHVLRFTGGELFETALTGRGGTGYQMITNVEDGDIFMLLGAQASSIVDYDAVARILDENESLPAMIKPLYESFAAADKTADCTIVLMKIKTDGKAAAPSGEPLKIFAEAAGAAAPAAASGDFGFAPAISSDEVDGMHRSRLDDYGDPIPEVRKPSLGRRLLTVLPIALVVILVGVAVGLYIATKDTRGNKNKPTAPAIESQTEPVTEAETESISFTDIININEDLSINQMTTTKEAEATTKAAAATTRASSSTTRSSSSSSSRSSATTTRAAATTTKKAETTTSDVDFPDLPEEEITTSGASFIDLDVDQPDNGGSDTPDDTPDDIPDDRPDDVPDNANDNAGDNTGNNDVEQIEEF